MRKGNKINASFRYFGMFCFIQNPVFPSRDFRYDEFGQKIKASNSSRQVKRVIKVTHFHLDSLPIL